MKGVDDVPESGIDDGVVSEGMGMDWRLSFFGSFFRGREEAEPMGIE